MAELPCTPGQTVGPFLSLGLPYPGDGELVGAEHPRAVRLHGTVYDGAGEPVPDALVELWQRDGDGRIPAQPGSLRRDDTAFTGWGRCATDAAGYYGFTTVAPGSDRGRAPFFAIAVFARGLLDRLFTRAYLPHDAVNADPALAPLVCIPESGGAAYRFDIHLQGPDETVFLEYRR
ncbi:MULTISPECIES: protocatechuate 3,4-dioxygenase subunit alpha [unclassified Mycobacterium]|uniref:protocatechuate 3,4-dioxygenase subunit alpha n=1 Tax=unclassified Mycobacterium TaxID=2642494 RepID=UPI0008011784|nr:MULTISPECIES: protocatechuate 3,4-dioxygenase subunit alpha [unclassified Mycobacterium]OBH02150.1 protocatechuate 3,4-dioxygenase subunit alpha [Mycobacterium sp. E2699]OBI53550.1 protocatechuate 3,4-dioxygenase subunit alpha [Mycobacterium sp. E787]